MLNYFKIRVFKPESYLLQVKLCLIFAQIKIFLNKDIMIKVTDSAKNKAIDLMKEDGKAGFFIRVGVKGGGCSGLMYELTFDNEINESDKSFEDNGVRVVVDKKSFLYLIGTTLDFSGGLNGKGFIFSNPNADRTCGCGESFSL